MGIDDWIYHHIPKELDKEVEEKLKKDPDAKKISIRKPHEFYTHLAREYVKGRFKL